MENIALEFDLLTDDITCDDDIDEMFSALNVSMPPANFVGRVMDAVAQLPLHRPALTSPWGSFDQMMVLADRTNLS